MTIYLDLDGPLLDISRRYHAVYRSIVVGLGARPLDREAYWGLKREGRREVEICRELHRGIDPTIYVHLFRERIESPGYLAHDNIVDGALATLASLHGSHRLVLATLRRRGVAMRRQLRAVGLEPILDAILQREDNDGGWRNKTAMILDDRKRDGDAVLVGDSEGDVDAARIAGIGSVAVFSGMRRRELLADREPDHLIETIRQLPSCLAAAPMEAE